MKILRFTLLALLALVLVLAGCSKQEAPPSPSPTPTPTPPPVKTGNADCTADPSSSTTCKITVAQIEAESGKPGHSCGDFDPATAITVATQATPPSGQWGAIHVVKAQDTDPDFTVTITPRPQNPPGPGPANPFSNMPPITPGKDWNSGGPNHGVVGQLPNKRYSMTVHVHAKGGSSKMKMLDPHIVFGG